MAADATATPTNNWDLNDDRNWSTMQCICNLCECGQHSCANYNLHNSTRTSKVQLDDQTRKHNRCALDAEHEMAAALQNKLNLIDTPDADVASCGPVSNERYLDASTINSDHVRHTKSRNRANRKPRNVPESGAGQMSLEGRGDDDAELMHVLVTKPAIASKPRDNIVFEGDMDLRTTFETSYEALAKMRLDCWKKYQEAKRGLWTPTDEPDDDEAVTVAAGYRADSRELDHKSRRHYNRKLTDEPQHGAELDDVDHTTGAQNDVSVQPELESNLKRKATKLDDSGENTNHANSSVGARDVEDDHLQHQQRQPQQQHSSNKLHRSHTVRHTRSVSNNDAAAAADDDDIAGHQPIMIDRQAQTTFDNVVLDDSLASNYVDPDLSSIIVYDANMNRLERVGLRKRSKYRPSTSLRAGPRGLFGDQQTEPETRTPKDTDTTVGQTATAARYQHAAGTPSNNARFAASKSSSSNELVRRTRQVSDARNLTNSNQPNSLTYSHHNLPIDSKRKCKDNVNMTDHIRDHNIVASSAFMDADTVGYDEHDEKRQVVCDYYDMASPSNNDMNTKQLEEINRLNELEEAAAVDEIRRCTVGADGHKTPTSQLQTQTDVAGRSSNQTENYTPVGGAEAGRSSNNSSRQTRLHKTCQQQNFYIFDNQYPEPKTPLHAREGSRIEAASGHKMTSPPVRNYKNLFRESPDFILTTGKLIELHPRMSVVSEREVKDIFTAENHSMQLQNESTDTDRASKQGEKYERRSSQRASPTKHDCIVHKLGQEFEVVQSRSGHKYFVQKPSIGGGNN